MCVQHGVEIGGLFRVDDRASNLQGTNRGFRVGTTNAEQEGYEQHAWQRQLFRQAAANDVAERHQTELEAFHEDHQTDHHSDQAAADQGGVSHRALQHDVLEQCQKQGQGHHGTGLLHEACIEVGLENVCDVSAR